MSLNNSVLKELEKEVERISFLYGGREIGKDEARVILLGACNNFATCVEKDDALLLFASAFIFIDALRKEREKGREPKIDSQDDSKPLDGF